MTVDPQRFREVMGLFTTGVTVVTGVDSNGTPCGFTANSLTSVSLNPVLVLVCVDQGSTSHPCLTEGSGFAVSILGREDEELAARFTRGAWGDRFESLATRAEVTGSPILTSALAWMDCEVRDVHAAGDHSILVGEVVSCGARDGEPLVFFKGAFGRIPQ